MSNEHKEQEHPLDAVFLNMSALVAHQLIMTGISSSVPRRTDTEKLRQVCLSTSLTARGLTDSEVIDLLEKNGTSIDDSTFNP